jgi:hypothetical protein
MTLPARAARAPTVPGGLDLVGHRCDPPFSSTIRIAIDDPHRDP